MKRSISFFAVATLFIAANDAHGQVKAAPALPPESSNGGAGSACINNCAQRTSACTMAGARGPNPVEAGRQCAAQSLACSQACAASSHSQSALPAPRSPGTQRPSPGSDDEGDDNPVEAATAAAFDQLLRSWLATDKKRLAAANENAAKLVNDVLQVLCHQLNVAACTTGTGESSLVPKPVRRSDGDRWTKNFPAPSPPSSYSSSTSSLTTASSTTSTSGRSGKRPTSTSTKGAGCYVEVDAHVAGSWGSNKLFVQTPMFAYFPERQGNRLRVENHTNKVAWAGYWGHPLNHDVPPNGSTYIPFGPVYRQKDDFRSNEADITVKFWSTDEKTCAAAGGGVKPGFTTPEEWGTGERGGGDGAGSTGGTQSGDFHAIQ